MFKNFTLVFLRGEFLSYSSYFYVLKWFICLVLALGNICLKCSCAYICISYNSHHLFCFAFLYLRLTVSIRSPYFQYVWYSGDPSKILKYLYSCFEKPPSTYLDFSPSLWCTQEIVNVFQQRLRQRFRSGSNWNAWNLVYFFHLCLLKNSGGSIQKTVRLFEEAFNSSLKHLDLFPKTSAFNHSVSLSLSKFSQVLGFEIKEDVVNFRAVAKSALFGSEPFKISPRKLCNEGSYRWLHFVTICCFINADNLGQQQHYLCQLNRPNMSTFNLVLSAAFFRKLISISFAFVNQG